jgi:hypothetical protein
VDALVLVRFGLRAADDPRILNTVKVLITMSGFAGDIRGQRFGGSFSSRLGRAVERSIAQHRNNRRRPPGAGNRRVKTKQASHKWLA